MKTIKIVVENKIFDEIDKGNNVAKETLKLMLENADSHFYRGDILKSKWRLEGNYRIMTISGFTEIESI